MTETAISATLRDAAKKAGYFYERIENLVASGTPDAFLAFDGMYCFAELKQAKGKKQTITVQKTQPAWHINARKKGVHCYFLVGYEGQYACFTIQDILEKCQESMQNKYKNGKEFKINLENLGLFYFHEPLLAVITRHLSATGCEG